MIVHALAQHKLLRAVCMSRFTLTVMSSNTTQSAEHKFWLRGLLFGMCVCIQRVHVLKKSAATSPRRHRPGLQDMKVHKPLGEQTSRWLWNCTRRAFTQKKRIHKNLRRRVQCKHYTKYIFPMFSAFLSQTSNLKAEKKVERKKYCIRVGLSTRNSCRCGEMLCHFFSLLLCCFFHFCPFAPFGMCKRQTECKSDSSSLLFNYNYFSTYSRVFVMFPFIIEMNMSIMRFPFMLRRRMNISRKSRI